MSIDEILDSYINGNISYVKGWLVNSTIGLGELLEHYIEYVQPSNEDIVLFVKRLEQA